MRNSPAEKRALFLAVAAVVLLRLLAWGVAVEPARADSSLNQTIPTMTPTGGPGPGPITPPTRDPGPDPTDQATRPPGESTAPVEPSPGTPVPVTGTPSSTIPAPTIEPGATASLAPVGDTPVAGGATPTGATETPNAPSPTAGPALSPTGAGVTPAAFGAASTQVPAPLRTEPGGAAAPAATAAGRALPVACIWPALGLVLLAVGAGLLVADRRRTA